MPIRVIPTLLLRGGGLVKTVKFKNAKYLGDPRNTVKIFNDREVDELMLLDVTATSEQRRPRFDLIREIVSEAFMPVAYGGGIHDIETVRTLIELGIEKVALCTAAVERPGLIAEIADVFGTQSMLVCIDAKRKLLGGYDVYTHAGLRSARRSPGEHAAECERLGAGEILINSMDRDGTMLGYDLELVQQVTQSVTVPVIASGGAGSLADFGAVVKESGASAVSAGSMFVFHGRHRAVLISYPTPDELERFLGPRW